MDEAMGAGIEQEVIAELTIELRGESTFNEDILAVKVRNAIRELKMRRNYSATSFSENDIEKDIYNYYSTIVNVARYDYNQLGAEGESNHSENSVSRSWVDRDELFRGVHAFVKVL